MDEFSIDRQQLVDLISKLNEFSGMPIDIFAVGGTALTLLEFKDSTRDVDFNIASAKGYAEVEKLFLKMGFEKIGPMKWKTDLGMLVDLFKEGYIFCVQLPDDYSKTSKEIMNLGKIRLFAINPYDIIITKLGRGDERDFDDIRAVLTKEKIKIKNLVDRYIETMNHSFVQYARENMLILLKEKMKEWNMKTNKKAIHEVEKWQTRT